MSQHDVTAIKFDYKLGGVEKGSYVVILEILFSAHKPMPASSSLVLPHCRENTYDAVGPKESTAMSAHVAMETNPAYGVCSSKQ